MDERDPALANKPFLSPSRAFVLQFYPQAKVAQGVFVGRVEHVVLGQATRFSTLERVLTEVDVAADQ